MAGNARAFFGDWFLGNLHQDFLAFFQQVTNRGHRPCRLVPWASTHAASTLSPASATAIWPALCTLLITGRRRSTLFSACAFQVFRFFFSLFTVFCFISGFFCQSKSFFHLLQLFRIQPFSLILAGCLFVNVSIAYSFHQLTAHRNHLIAGPAKNFFFQLFIFGHVQVFLKPRHFAFFLFDLFFFHHSLE